MEEREGGKKLDPLGKKGALYRSPRQRAVAEKLRPESPAHLVLLRSEQHDDTLCLEAGVGPE